MTDIMARNIPYLLGVIFSLLLTSCDDSKQHITLNSDMSGKADIEFRYHVNLKDCGVKRKAYPEIETDFMESCIERATGVEAWSALSCEYVKADSQMVFKGQAYFPDLAKFSFGAFKAKFGNMTVTSGANGQWTVEKQGDGQVKLTYTPALAVPDDTDDSPDTPPTDDAEAKQLLANAQERFEAQSFLIENFLSKLNMDIKVKASGPISETSVFTKEDSQTVALVADSASAMKSIRSVQSDEAKLTAWIKQGYYGENDVSPPNCLYHVFSESGAPLHFTFRPDGKNFSYYKEVLNADRRAQ